METAIHTSENITVPLSSLFLSPANVRRVSPTSIENMAASIRAVGQLQNLIAVRDEAGKFGVIVGGRRLRGMQLLHERGELADDFPVKIAIRDDADSTIVSLTENVEREDMHPADEYEAFSKLAEAGHTIDRIADAFGVTPLVVERRLSLGNASPELIEMFRRDEISTDQMIALCSTPDHERQLAAWNGAPRWDRSANQLRRMVTTGEVDSKRDPRVAFIGGVQAYEAAGGTFRRDLFAESGDGSFLADEGLLESLFTAKLESEANAVKAEGWAWVEVSPTFDWQAFNRMGKVAGERGELGTEAAQTLSALNEETEALEQERAKIEDASEDDFTEAESERVDQIDERLREIRREVRRIENECPVTFSAEVMANAGAMVCVEGERLRIDRGLVKAADRKAMALADVGIEGGRETESAGRKGNAMSDALRRSLLGRRNHAVQMATARNTHVAKVLLAFQSLDLIEREHHSERAPCDFILRDYGEGTRTNHQVTGADAEQLGDELAEAAAKAIGKLPTKRAERWDALMAKSSAELDEIIAFGVAASVSVLDSHSGLTGKLLTSLEFDVTDHVSMTADNYFTRVTKPMILDAMKDAGLDHDRAELDGMKKGKLAEEAERRFVEAGSRWVPKLIRSPKPKAPKPLAEPKKAAAPKAAGKAKRSA